MVAKIQAWELSRKPGSAATSVATASAPPARAPITVLHDDDESSESDADPVPLEILLMEEAADGPGHISDMELEPNVDEHADTESEPESEAPMPAPESSEQRVADVEFIDDDFDLLD
jgi:hypothetical protein